jgi:NAD(P)-dependent dehydrogenase (short-subunit alcohol dehydrogenase family)
VSGAVRSVVVTGATDGLGRAIADEFLDRGARVTICGRDADRLAAAIVGLAAGDPSRGARIAGVACDVADPDATARLWDAAVAAHGGVDLWIANAGVARAARSFLEQPDAEFEEMVRTNLLGTVRSAREVAKRMIGSGRGALYLMLGAGADGKPVPGMLGYGTTKCALRHFADGLASECSAAPIVVGSISPGLILTGPVLRGLARMPPAMQATRVAYMNRIADTPAESAAWIADLTTNNATTGRCFVRLTPLVLRSRLLWRRWFGPTRLTWPPPAPP